MTLKSQLSRENHELAVFCAAIIAANVLAMLQVHGPLQMSFSLSAVPILIVSLALGWETGSMVGIYGGVLQAINYGSPLYILYSMIMGGVSGFFAKNHGLTKRWGSTLFAVGVFFMFIWMTTVGLSYMTPEIIAILMALTVFCAIEYTMLKKHLAHNPLLNMTLAACAGVAACIPYDIAILTFSQGYELFASLAVVAKDLTQDYLAAIIAAVLLQHKTLRKALELPSRVR